MDLSSVDVEDLIERLGLRGASLASGGREVKFRCFGAEHSHGDERPSAYINVETTAWMCHGCHLKGSAVHLVMGVQQVSQATAERFLRDTYGIEFDQPLHGSMVAETEARFREIEASPPLTPAPESWLNGARLDWHRGPYEPFQEYILQRGFSAETLDEYDIGYDYFSDRVTIPVRDVEGNLVGIKARDWTGERQPKYMILGDSANRTTYGFQPYESSEHLFGLHRRRDHRVAVLLEGELNAIALTQMGVERPIATGMSYFSERHAQLLVREVDEVIAFYDHGPAGHNGVWGQVSASGNFQPGVVQALEPYLRVRVVEPLPEDPAELLVQGRQQECLQLIEQAQSTVAIMTTFV